MAVSSKTISLDIIIPTLNAEAVLENCLKAISGQIAPNVNINIYIADGGSSDNTLSIAKKYNCKIISNPLKTGEAGKAVGYHHTKSEFISFIDSDNILPDSNWVMEMLRPLTRNPKIIGSEPIYFTYRREAGLIERYSSLIGANDPYAFVNGVSDRINYINFRWTSLPIHTVDRESYLEITLKPYQKITTIGANGTIYRRSFLDQLNLEDYLFDIDLFSTYFDKFPKSLKFAKVKNSIIHTYCENSIPKFIVKQNRRIRDYFTFKSRRKYQWHQQENSLLSLASQNIKFAAYSALIFPSLIDSIRGWLHKPDIAWFFHPAACLITLSIYVYYTILHFLGFNISQNRNSWKQ